MERQRRNRRLWVLSAVVGVAAIVVITVVAAQGGGSGSGDVTLKEIQPVAVSGTPLPDFTAGAPDAAIGTRAPRIDGKTFGSRSISLKPGQRTLVVVLSHWSSDSDAEARALVAWHHSGKAPAGLDVVGVISGSDPQRPNYPASTWLLNVEWPWPVLVDDAVTSAQKALGFATVPGIVMIDAAGTVKYRAAGQVPIDVVVQQLRAQLGV